MHNEVVFTIQPRSNAAGEFVGPCNMIENTTFVVVMVSVDGDERGDHCLVRTDGRGFDDWCRYNMGQGGGGKGRSLSRHSLECTDLLSYLVAFAFLFPELVTIGAECGRGGASRWH